MAVGVLVVRNDVRSDVEAYLKNVTVRGNTAGTVGAGSVSVTALEHAAISAQDESTVTSSGGMSLNGTFVTNLVLSQANAYIQASDVRTTGDITLDAQNISNIDATVLAASSSGG